MPRKPKMPQYVGLLLENGKFCGPLYRVTMRIAPDNFGISRDATNEEMLRGFLECVTSAARDAAAASAAAARAEGEAAGRAAERERVLALVRAAYAAAREVEVQHDVLDPSAASGALDVLEQAVERGEHVGAAGGAA